MPLRSFVTVILSAIKVFILFMGCTLLFYYGILWVSKEYESYHRYDEPQGRAVKVVQMEGTDPNTHWFMDRLLFFYHYGE
ncbi:YqzK family protein [Desertibacillus haloalkaliphilus]|uniref:YqzK family protein n=1 Tax=Desertibacillus haloalkaliphilus TaxID=1328930 RepID=UPI001C25476B|nr:YqzK family protein [Desertibacillus haloalkaliphilus]MBU8907863.1 YqzK family protein [Desertibacillus haloalkaliphilus]